MSKEKSFSPKTNILEIFKDKSIEAVVIYKQTKSNGNVNMEKLVKIAEISVDDDNVYILKYGKSYSNDPKYKMRHFKNMYREYRSHRLVYSLTKICPKIYDIESIWNNDTLKSEILMDYGGVSLVNLMENLGTENFLRIINQLLYKMTLLERIGVSHFDLKPGNIAWDSDNKKLSIIDFGAAISFHDNLEDIYNPMDSNSILECTKSYAPPEIDSKTLIPQKFDAYSIGLVLKKMLDTTDVFDHGANLESKKFIKEKLKKLITKCLDENYLERPSFKFLYEEYVNIINTDDTYSSILDENYKLHIPHSIKQAKKFYKQGLYIAVIIILLDLKTRSNNYNDSITMWIMLGKSYVKIGNYNAATKCFSEAKEIILEDDYVNLVKLNLCFSCVYSELGYYDKCHCELFDAENILEEKHLKNKRLFAKIYNNLGFLYCRCKDSTEAKKYIEKAIKLYESLKDDKIYLSYNYMGLILTKKQEYDASYKYFSKALRRCKRIYIKDHPKFMDIYGNMGNVFYMKKMYSEAICYYTKAMRVCLKNYDSNHPGLGTLCKDLAMVYNKLGKTQIALNYFEMSLDALEEAYGKFHPEVASTYKAIGAMYEDMIKYKDAKKWYKKCKNVCDEIYGEDNENTIEITKTLEEVEKILKNTSLFV